MTEWPTSPGLFSERKRQVQCPIVQGCDQLYLFASRSRTMRNIPPAASALSLQLGPSAVCGGWWLVGGGGVEGENSFLPPACEKTSCNPREKFSPLTLTIPAPLLLSCQKQCMGIRASKPHTSLFFQTLSSACLVNTSCLQQEGIGDQPTGQDVGHEQLPKGNSLGPVESEAFRSRKATLSGFRLSSCV